MYWDPGCNLIGFSARSFGASGKNLLKHYTIRDHFLTLKTSCQALLLIVNSYQSSLLECRGGEGLYLYIDISYQHQYSNHMHTGTEFFMCTLMHKLYTVIYNHMEGHTVRHASTTHHTPCPHITTMPSCIVCIFSRKFCQPLLLSNREELLITWSDSRALLNDYLEYYNLKKNDLFSRTSKHVNSWIYIFIHVAILHTCKAALLAYIIPHSHSSDHQWLTASCTDKQTALSIYFDCTQLTINCTPSLSSPIYWLSAMATLSEYANCIQTH